MLSDLTREQAYRRWKKGEDQHALAKEMGVTRERMRHILKKMDENVPLVDRIEELEAKLAKVISLADNMAEAIEDQIDICDASTDEQIAVKNYRTTLAELTGGKDD